MDIAHIPNAKAFYYIKKKLVDMKQDSYTRIMENFNTSLSSMERSISSHNPKRKTRGNLHYGPNELSWYLHNFDPTAAEYSLNSTAWDFC